MAQKRVVVVLSIEGNEDWVSGLWKRDAVIFNKKGTIKVMCRTDLRTDETWWGGVLRELSLLGSQKLSLPR